MRRAIVSGYGGPITGVLLHPPKLRLGVKGRLQQNTSYPPPGIRTSIGHRGLLPARSGALPVPLRGVRSPLWGCCGHPCPRLRPSAESAGGPPPRGVTPLRGGNVLYGRTGRLQSPPESGKSFALRLFDSDPRGSDNPGRTGIRPCGRPVVPTPAVRIGVTDRTRGLLPLECPSWH